MKMKIMLVVMVLVQFGLIENLERKRYRRRLMKRSGRLQNSRSRRLKSQNRPLAVVASQDKTPIQKNKPGLNGQMQSQQNNLSIQSRRLKVKLDDGMMRSLVDDTFKNLIKKMQESIEEKAKNSDINYTDLYMLKVTQAVINDPQLYDRCLANPDEQCRQLIQTNKDFLKIPPQAKKDDFLDQDKNFGQDILMRLLTPTRQQLEKTLGIILQSYTKPYIYKIGDLTGFAQKGSNYYCNADIQSQKISKQCTCIQKKKGDCQMIEGFEYTYQLTEQGLNEIMEAQQTFNDNFFSQTKACVQVNCDKMTQIILETVKQYDQKIQEVIQKEKQEAEDQNPDNIDAKQLENQNACDNQVDIARRLRKNLQSKKMKRRLKKRRRHYAQRME